MAINYNNLYNNYEPRMTPTLANSAHDYHIIEFEAMCQDMISKALEAHDQQIQIDVQTTLNGSPCNLSGLVSDIKKQIMDKLRRAFK